METTELFNQVIQRSKILQEQASDDFAVRLELKQKLSYFITVIQEQIRRVDSIEENIRNVRKESAVEVLR